MLFNSYPFLFCFLPLLLLLWRVVGSTAGGGCLAFVLLAFSLVFYGLSGAPFLLLLLTLVAVNYAFGQVLAEQDEVFASRRRRLSRRNLFALALTVNILPLLWFKYSGFLAQNLSLLFGGDLRFIPPGLPLGISFYTFIQVAWLLGVYKRRFTPEGFFRHALFSSCFPYVISGPIVRYEQIGSQFDSLTLPDAESTAKGLSLFSIGLAKKVLLADSLAVYANAVFNAAESHFPLSGGEAWLGSLCYTFQLYFDFSGYTDMALGIGMMLGLRLPENFDSPYKSTGIVDFWRRWHITLGAWLRDCLYIPFGGNRAGRLKQYRNLFLTMFIGGIWHGAGWTFVIWGALHGLMLCVNHFFKSKIKGSPAERALSSLPCRIFFILLTFVCINACWVVFRSLTVHGAMSMYAAMLHGPFAVSGAEGCLAALLPNNYFLGWQPFALLALSFVLVWAFPNSRELLRGRADGSSPWLRWSPSALWAGGLAALVFVCLILASRKSTFLYFQF
ncbi:MAG: MBOAT family protein [Desulfovibrio sp.]|nr:MBOAT family protein [Desulfovibrio sp.]